VGYEGSLKMCRRVHIFGVRDGERERMCARALARKSWGGVIERERGGVRTCVRVKGEVCLVAVY